MAKARSKRNWIKNVATVSTYPPQGTFALPAEKLAKVMASPEVSPKGLGSAIRMVQFFINRSGKNLTPQRRRELERAKRILQKMAREE
jgi:hypothetical protein